MCFVIAKIRLFSNMENNIMDREGMSGINKKQAFRKGRLVLIIAYDKCQREGDQPPKLSYIMLSSATPRLSSIATTALLIGPGPHM